MKNHLFTLSALIMSVVLLTGIALFFIWRPGLEDHVEIDEDFFMKRLEVLAGPTAIICEEAYIPPSGAAPPACLTRAVESDAPFLASLKFRPWGNHEVIYAGLVRDKAGRLWLLWFDPDRTGGHGEKRKPWLQTSNCRTFELPDVIRHWQLCGDER